MANSSDGTDWAAYGRTFDETHFSPLADINEKTVARLGLAWSIDLPSQISTHSAPLAVGGVLFYATGLSHVFAVEATTGKQLWEYDPHVADRLGDEGQLAWGIRGIAYWHGKIFVGTQDGRLLALNAASGSLVWSAQTTSPGDGRYITGAPRVFDGRVIIGHGGADFSAVRGYVTAYNAETGKQLWRFYTVPGDPSKGFEDEAMAMAARTWTGDQWKKGGGGTVWNAITYDADLHRIYLGVGNGSPWNAKIRSPQGGDNLFLASIVALDADTGKYLWHYQQNPAESWDRNSAMDIELATLTIEGRPRRVILHAPKNGFFYVIDRETGKLVSAEPFAKQNWAERIDLKSGRPVEIASLRYPPSGKAIVWPSGAGAHSWQPMAFSPKTKLVYIPTTEMPGLFDDAGIDPATWVRASSVAADSSYNPLKIDGPLPAVGASLGHLQAWDPVRQKRVWSVDLGAPFNGGVMATGGNLVLQGNMKGRFVAYSADKGTALWSFDAQNGIVAQPITYRAKGRQYVTVMTGVGGVPGLLGGIGAPLWDYRQQKRRLLTFALDGKASLPPSSKEDARQITKPIPIKADPHVIETGEAIYAARCALCHGGAARAGGAAPDLRLSPVLSDAAAFEQVVRAGALRTQGMPRFKLSDSDLATLRAYIRSEPAE